MVNLRVTGYFKYRIFYSQDIFLNLKYLCIIECNHCRILLSQMFEKIAFSRRIEKRILLQDIYNLK